MKSLMNIKIVTVLALVLLMINSCTEDWPEMNTRNTLVTEDVLDTDLVITYVLHRAIIDDPGLGGGAGTEGNYCGMSTNCDNNEIQSMAHDSQ